MKSKTDTLLQGTIIEDILKIAKKGDFSGAKFYGDKEGRILKKLGEMTPFEKACFAYFSSLVKEIEELKEKVRHEKRSEAEAERGFILDERINATKKIMWLSILGRFKYFKNESVLDLREGFKIVVVEKKEQNKCDCPGCQAERAGGVNPLDLLTLAMLGGGMRRG